MLAYAGVVTSSSPLGRRELNKARTHEAIVTALRELVERMPVEEITVDQVAERAGISRRTFFNYFGSIPAVLSSAMADLAAQMLGMIDADALRRDPVTAMRDLVSRGDIPLDLLGWLAALTHEGTQTDAGVLVERTVWSDLAAWLEEQLHPMLASSDPLYVPTLAAAVMSCFKAAEQAWATQLGTDGADGALSPTDVAAFHDHLDRALGHLAQGWRPTT